MAKYPTFLAGQTLTAALLTASQPDIVVKASTESVTSSTTFQNDDELLLSVEANATYAVELFLVHSSATAGDIKIQFTGPSGATFTWGAHGAEVGTTSSGAVTEVVMSSRTISEVVQLGGGASTGTIAFVRGTLITSATAGTLTLQWAQVTSSASASQVRAGSFLKARRTA